MNRSEKIRQTTIKCIVLNGLIFLGFLYIFNYYMKSFLHSIMSLLVSTMNKEQAGMVVAYGFFGEIFRHVYNIVEYS